MTPNNDVDMSSSTDNVDGGAERGNMLIHFNELMPAELERLALVNEECSEVQQIISKIIRHGYESCRPDDMTTTNRDLLAEEIGHVLATIDLMLNANDLLRRRVEASREAKPVKMAQYLHHNKPTRQPARDPEPPHDDARV